MTYDDIRKFQHAHPVRSLKLRIQPAIEAPQGLDFVSFDRSCLLVASLVRVRFRAAQVRYVGAVARREWLEWGLW